MNLSASKIKEVYLKKGYSWDEKKPIIGGIRSSMNVPNVFNDVLFLIIPGKVEKYYTITTDPGTTYLKHPINPKGCFIMKPGQHKDCWSLGYHQHKADHKALRQVGNITGYRDNDKDAEFDMVTGTEETSAGNGVNCHGTKKGYVTKEVGPWSAGCQVFLVWMEKEEFINFLCEWEKANKSFWKKITDWVFGTSGIRYTYTLLEEKDFA